MQRRFLFVCVSSDYTPTTSSGRCPLQQGTPMPSKTDDRMENGKACTRSTVVIKDIYHLRARVCAGGCSSFPFPISARQRKANKNNALACVGTNPHTVPRVLSLSRRGSLNINNHAWYIKTQGFGSVGASISRWSCLGGPV